MNASLSTEAFEALETPPDAGVWGQKTASRRKIGLAEVNIWRKSYLAAESRRCRYMARWIDDLAVEQVDTDGDGSLETTLYPITDLLGSVQLLTDDAGTPVERITYDPDGTPHFWSADTTRPSVTRIAWTGDGTMPTGDTVTAQAFEIGLSEPIDPASAASATATLTPDGGDPQSLTLTLGADGRAAYLTGATVTAGTTYTLHLDGLTDTSHNPMWPEDKQLTVTDSNAYEVLNDTTAPTLLAVLDGSDAIYLLFDEPIEPAAGYDLTSAVAITRAGQPVDGTATRVTSRLLKWTPAEPATYPLGGTFAISALHLADLNANTISSTPTTFTHLNTTTDMVLLAYAAPTDTQPEATSAYGVTNLFQGRTWHQDLGMYSYRARWYLPEMGEFGERDPIWPPKHANRFEAFDSRPTGVRDPLGRDAWTRDFNSFISRKERENAREWAERNSNFKAEALGWIDLVADVTASDSTKAEVDFMLDMAEKYNGASGVSIEGTLAWPMIGVAGGINLEVFHKDNGRNTYDMGLYGLETISNFKKSERAKFNDVQKVLAPFGVSGFGIGPAASYNIAIARGPAYNTPEKWLGAFGTYSVSSPLMGPPVSASVSYFDSDFFSGVEISLTAGYSVFVYTRPLFHKVNFWRDVPRDTVRAVYSILAGTAKRLSP